MKFVDSKYKTKEGINILEKPTIFIFKQLLA